MVEILKNIQSSLGYEELTLEEFIKAFHVSENIANVKLNCWYDENDFMNIENDTILDAEFIHLIDTDNNIEWIYMYNNGILYNDEDFEIEC